MGKPAVILRKMTETEYRHATEYREAEGIRALARFMDEDEARKRVAQGTAHFLPDGRDTEGHHLLVAENETGDVVGNAWVGPDPEGTTGTAESAWLYDINVDERYRRRGYGSAILAAVEDLVAQEGRTRLALNVVGDNDTAIALYRRSGYAVASMVMDKTLGR
ncbi:GNAT family N-acetyltransferase [Nocardia cyriacigeorgica]|uniref:GNAT family N-acetyltransferase n=1 Tax=Nocardia cyriacigeorgica TaxID=135487 RepID=UPI0024569081|nr:GNAT family N-acetyltransferase [Nocardia cyriacigeorgica]